MAARICSPTRDLLALYRDPAQAPGLDGARWADVLGATRRSRTLGHLGLTLRLAGVADRLDPRVATHLVSSATLIAHRRGQLRRELLALARALAGLGTDVVLLKGAAYEALDLPLASARLPGDLDILVPRDRIADIEGALRRDGYAPAPLDDHDERYYREWSHELPPLSHPERGVEVDVHHAITPAMRGPGIDVAPLLANSVAIDLPGRCRFRVLDPIDQLFHCALHTFKDSDLSLRLRETMDFDLLYRHRRPRLPALDEAIAARALELGQARPVWWSAHFAHRWLGTPIDGLLQRLPTPPAAAVRWMERLCDRAMLPGARQERHGLDRLAAAALLARYQYQRLPLSKLLPHLIEKSRRRVLPAAGERFKSATRR